MKINTIALLCLMGAALIASPVSAQSYVGQVYTVAERQPEFPGGKVALGRYLASTIRFPSSLMRKNYDTGPVAAKFIIDELGYVHDVRVTIKPLDKKSRKGMQEFMTSIIASIEQMPRWEPGEVDGKRVAVFYTLPVEVNMH